MANVHNIDGFKEAKKLLENLDKVTQKKVVLSILRKASRPIIKAAKWRIAPYSKRVAASIRFGQIRSAKKLAGSIKPRGKNAWYAHFIEFGTSGIIKKGGGYKRESDNKQFAWVGKLKRGSRFRIDQQAHPYMRPAIDENKVKTKSELNRLFKDDIEKTIKKFKK